MRHVYLGEAFPTDTEYLFPGRLSQQLTRRHAESLVRQYAADAGIGRRVYPHMLRSTFATEVTRSGIGLEHLRKTMGWTSLEMVKVYVEAFDSDAQAASRKHSPMGRLEMGKRGAR